MSVATVLEIDGLEARFGPVVAVCAFSLAVAAGERVGLVGPNGAGKTTVLNCVSGLVRPAAGTVVVRGEVGRTLQRGALLADLDVEANLLLGAGRRMRAGLVACGLRLSAARREEGDARARCRTIAAELGLAGELATPVARLGAGARKRLELARALAGEPDLLLLDEPFAGAGPGDVALMAAAVARSGAAAVVVDHDLDAVAGLCHRVVTMA